MADLIGQQIGNYTITRLLGEGGFASVYLGQHVRIAAQQAAIKHLKTHVTGADIQLFQHEAELIATLAHPHIVRLLDFEVKDGDPFLIMEYAPNGSLRQHHPRGQRVPLSTILSYLRQLAEALSYAHSQKLVHRDIKPENMLVGRRGELLLSDFGIAIIAQSTYATQYVGGTAAYMAPEQFRGHATPLSDQYSLAIVVYEWLCGEPPFTQGDFIQLGYQHNYSAPPPLSAKEPTVPPEVEQVVMKALEKDPQARFPSVQAFVEALTAVTQPAFSGTGTLLLAYKEHNNWLHSVAWSPDGTRIASASADGTVQLWEAETGKAQHFFYGHREAVWSVAWSPDGTAIVSGASDKTMQVWEVTTGRRQLLLTRNADVQGVCWSPDSTRVAGGAADGTIQIYDVRQSRLLHTLKGHSAGVWSVAWSQDGFRLASASDDKTVQVWHAVTGQQLLVLRGHSKAVIAVAWSPDGTRLASASDDKTVRLWHAITGQLLATYTRHSDEVWSVAWSPDGTHLASASRDKTVHIWDSTGTRTRYIYRAHASEVNAVAWSPDGTRLASAAWDNSVHIWQVSTR